MNDLEAMKGARTVLASTRGGARLVQLVSYVDGSVGIIRNGTSLGIWEPAERASCFGTFVRLGRFYDTTYTTILRHRPADERVALTAIATLN